MAIDAYKPVRVNSQKLTFIQHALHDLGLDVEYIFSQDMVEDLTDERTSMGVVLEIYKKLNAFDYPMLGLELGKRIRVKHYGLYGCVLLCREDLQSALNFSIRYHDMVTRTTRMYLHTLENGNWLFGCEDILGMPEIKFFNLEFQCGIELSLIRDILYEPNYSPVKVYLESSKPENTLVHEQFFNCDVIYGHSFTGLEFTREQLSTRFPKGNELAIPILLKSCDDELHKQLAGNDFLLTVYKWVSENVHRNMNASVLAEHLCMTERTLRRKLARHDICYSDICAEVKSKLAKQYVCETGLSMDDIAASLGFSDTANFRRAFKQWTNQAPSQYRNSYKVG
jgi:AraC-like DNA-binding protein